MSDPLAHRLRGNLEPTAPVAPRRPEPAPPAGGGGRFDQVLRQRLQQAGGVEFSAHALDRLQRRGIELDASQLQRLGDGVDRAAAKGSRDALVLVDQLAFVVGVPRRTVITTIDQEHLRQHVFTNIDAAVIA